jgi:threonyl-tRNA synthetase
MDRNAKSPTAAPSCSLAESIGRGLAKAAVVGKVDDKSRRSFVPLTGEHKVSDRHRQRSRSADGASPQHRSRDGRGDSAIWPQAQLAYGPPLENGFYYDIALDAPISSNDFAKIEAEMQKIVTENRPFTRYELPPDKGMDRLKAEANKYKIDNAQRAIAGGAGSLSWYVTGPVQENGKPACWEDLCMGPHVPSTGKVKAFK